MRYFGADGHRHLGPIAWIFAPLLSALFLSWISPVAAQSYRQPSAVSGSDDSAIQPLRPNRDWAQCGGAFVIPVAPAPETEPGAPGSVQMSADSADIRDAGVSQFDGNVIMRDGERILAADSARYDKVSERLDAKGNLRFWEDTMYFTGTAGYMDFAGDRIEVEGVGFREFDSHSRGTAQNFSMSGSDLIEIEKGVYTTCNPGSDAWYLEAGSIKLNRISDIGTARNVTVRIKGIPVFYTPYMTFPLSDQRKTGFLFPGFRISGDAGSEINIPFYFNLAPNYDATLNARITTERGIALGGEFRYLYPWGEGELRSEVLPNDPRHGGARGLFAYRHFGQFHENRFTTWIHYDRVSDREYFEDLGNSLRVASTTHLLQQALVRYAGNRWGATGLIQNYQTVDRTIPGVDRPYRQLPNLQFYTTFSERNRRLNGQARAQFVFFDRSDTVTGMRVDLEPTLTFPVRSGGWFFVPRLALRHTFYDLNNQAVGTDDTPSRTVPIASVDSGLFLEKEVTLWGHEFRHTLEPRLFYVAIPFVDQTDLPTFDTGEFTFNFGQLFRTNRFSGPDRIGDTNQLAVAMTSRLLSRNGGRELARATVGQIRYFQDRDVVIDDAVPDRRDGSDIVAEVSANVARQWAVKGGLQWDPDAGETNKSVLSLRYQPSPGRVVNFGYRFVRDEVEQTDISFRWPVDHQLSFVGRFDFSLDGGDLLETFGGIEYETCCWAIRAVGRRFLTSEEGEYNNSVLLQVELKGLAGVGKKAEAFVRRSIPGYQNEY